MAGKFGTAIKRIEKLSSLSQDESMSISENTTGERDE